MLMVTVHPSTHLFICTIKVSGYFFWRITKEKLKLQFRSHDDNNPEENRNPIGSDKAPEGAHSKHAYIFMGEVPTLRPTVTIYPEGGGGQRCKITFHRVWNLKIYCRVTSKFMKTTQFRTLKYSAGF